MHIVKKQITIRAKPQEVWKALTDPVLTKQYFFKSEVHSDWKVGSPIYFKRKILWFTFTLQGKITQIEPEKLLQYKLLKHTFFSAPDPTNFSLVTDTLTYENDVTTLAISDNVGDKPGAERRYIRSVKGWDKILNGLKKLVEKTL